jgi:hypothetical protein
LQEPNEGSILGIGFMAISMRNQHAIPKSPCAASSDRGGLSAVVMQRPTGLRKACRETFQRLVDVVATALTVGKAGLGGKNGSLGLRRGGWRYSRCRVSDGVVVGVLRLKTSLVSATGQHTRHAAN